MHKCTDRYTTAFIVVYFSYMNQCEKARMCMYVQYESIGNSKNIYICIYIHI